MVPRALKPSLIPRLLIIVSSTFTSHGMLAGPVVAHEISVSGTTKPHSTSILSHKVSILANSSGVLANIHKLSANKTKFTDTPNPRLMPHPTSLHLRSKIFARTSRTTLKMLGAAGSPYKRDRVRLMGPVMEFLSNLMTERDLRIFRSHAGIKTSSRHGRSWDERQSHRPYGYRRLPRRWVVPIRWPSL
jgi:hypothetical protein